MGAGSVHDNDDTTMLGDSEMSLHFRPINADQTLGCTPKEETGRAIQNENEKTQG